VTIFWLVLVAIGLIKKQPRSYWTAVGWTVFIQVACQYLFHDRTGLLTPWVERVTGGGPMIAVFAVFGLTLAWGLPLFLVRRGYRRGPVPVSLPKPPSSN
jgi:hypothetical protein